MMRRYVTKLEVVEVEQLSMPWHTSYKDVIEGKTGDYKVTYPDGRLEVVTAQEFAARFVPVIA